MPRMRVGRLMALVFGSILSGVAILSWGHRPTPFPKTGIEIAAILGILVTVAVGLWAWQKKRVSLGLVLLLIGNTLTFSAILSPLSIEHKSWILTSGVSFYAMSLVSRLIKLARLVKADREAAAMKSGHPR